MRLDLLLTNAMAIIIVPHITWIYNMTHVKPSYF